MMRRLLIVAAALLLVGRTAHADDGDGDSRGALQPPSPEALARDDDGSLYRSALARGRRLVRDGADETAREWLEAAAASRHDRGWAVAELVHLACKAGPLPADVRQRAHRELAPWVDSDRAARAALEYELGRDAEQRGEVARAAAHYRRSLALRPSRDAEARHEQLRRAHPVELADAVVSASVLNESDVGLELTQCGTSADCHVFERREADGVTYLLAGLRRDRPESLPGLHVEGASVDSVVLAIGRGGRWWSVELLEWNVVPYHGSVGVDVRRFELLQAVPGGAMEMRVDTFVETWASEWCTSEYGFHETARVCGLHGSGAVCWAEIATVDEWHEQPGSVASAGDPAERAACGFPRGGVVARAAVVEVRYRAEIDADGRLTLRAPVPSPLDGPIAVRDVPTLLGVRGIADLECPPSLAEARNAGDAVSAVLRDPACP